MLSGIDRPPPGLSRQEPSSHAAWLGGAAIVLMLLLAAGILIYASDLILPGVEGLGVPLGGKLRSAAAADLIKAWQEQTLTLRVGSITETVKAISLGLELDAPAMAQQAHRQSRSLRQRDAPISPVVRLNIQAAQAALQQRAGRFAVPPTDADLRVVQGQVLAVPGVPGLEVDVAATLEWLNTGVRQIVLQGVLDLRTRPVPPAVSDMSSWVEKGNRWLAHTLLIQAYDPIPDETLDWPIAPQEWIGWMALRPDLRSSTGLTWTLNAAQVGMSVLTQTASLGPARYLDRTAIVPAVQAAIAQDTWTARLRVFHTARQHTVQAGETLASIARDYGIPYPWVQQVNPGLGDILRPGQTLVIPSPDTMLPLPIVENKRIVVSISRQAMWVYEDGTLKWLWPVSTGIASSPTSPGVFQIQSHQENAYAGSWNLWMPYFMGIYRPAPDTNVMNGFHGFPTRDGANLLWTGNLGAPVTFGCILLDTNNAAVLYNWAEEGVLVEIQP